jgi:DNA-binding MarR family transcriptional regulator
MAKELPARKPQEAVGPAPLLGGSEPSQAAGYAELPSRLRQAVSRLHRRFRQLAPSGMTPSRLSALATVDRAGSLSMGELAAAEGVAASTMTRIVDSLDRDGLVVRLADTRDRRVARVEIKAEGSRLLRGARSNVDRFLDEGLAKFDRMQLERLVWALDVLESLAESEPAVRSQRA